MLGKRGRRCNVAKQAGVENEGAGYGKVLILPSCLIEKMKKVENCIGQKNPHFNSLV